MARSDEVQSALAAYVDLRERIERGEATWTDLAGIFTDDAVYIDPAYGRVEGLDAIRRFLDESMRGLEDWRFPIEFTAVDGDNVIIKWTQLLPNGRRQSGYTRLIYAGDGKFRYEEDQLNMVHVLDDMKSMGWRPAPDFVPPPTQPNRDFSVP
jgi:ketosteroid isomerase-like protein